MPETKRKSKEKEELWKLVIRTKRRVLQENLTHDDGSKALLNCKENDKVLVPNNCIFLYWPSVGWIWTSP